MLQRPILRNERTKKHHLTYSCMIIDSFHRIFHIMSQLHSRRVSGLIDFESIWAHENREPWPQSN